MDQEIQFLHTAVQTVLRAGTWRRQFTSPRFYLMDLTHRTLDRHHLGPVWRPRRPCNIALLVSEQYSLVPLTHDGDR